MENKKAEDKKNALMAFINNFFYENFRSPTYREMETGTGISRTSCQNYLKELEENGYIKRSGTKIITHEIEQMITRNESKNRIIKKIYASDEEGTYIEIGSIELDEDIMPASEKPLILMNDNKNMFLMDINEKIIKR